MPCRAHIQNETGHNIVPSEQSKSGFTEHQNPSVHANQNGQDHSVSRPLTPPDTPPLDPPSNTSLYLYKPLPSLPNVNPKQTAVGYKAYKPGYMSLCYPETPGRKLTEYSMHVYKASRLRPDELFFKPQTSPSISTLSLADHTAPTQPTPRLPASLVPGIAPSDRPAEAHHPYEVGDPGILGVRLSVYDFRNTLPAGLRPDGPPLRWDSETAPQIAPLAHPKVPSLLDDAEVTRLRYGDEEVREQ